jgi:hypothetical protein
MAGMTNMAEMPSHNNHLARRPSIRTLIANQLIFVLLLVTKN